VHGGAVVKDHAEEIALANPTMPKGIYNRTADNWHPLLAIADLAGGEWPERARQATIELSREGGDAESARVQLLADLRELFDAEASGVLFTKEILADLSKRDDRPWSEWKNGKPITGRQVATLLKPLGITTNQTVRRGSDHDKGYRREWFDDVFVRYLPALQSVTRRQVVDSAAFHDFRSVTSKNNVTDGSSQNASVSAGCPRVTDQEPPSLDDETVTWTG
jgi:hypothetical protein